MARVIERAEPFSGELVRLYEEGKNRPGVDARKALALVFNLSESEIEFGKQQHAARQPAAEYRSISELALDVARRFDELSPACQKHVSHQIDLLKGTLANNGNRERAAQHDLVIKDGAAQSGGKKKRQKS